MRAVLAGVLRAWWPVLVGFALVIATGILLRCTPEPPEVDPPRPDPALTRELEALRKSHAAYRATMDSLNRVASAAEAEANRRRLDALASQRRADSLAREADRFARDTMWREAYEARTAEADTLRAVLVERERENVQLRQSVIVWRDAAFTADARAEREAAARGAVTIERDMFAAALREERRKDRCVFGLLNCPTRKAAFVAGNITGAVVTGVIGVAVVSAVQ